MLTPSPLLCWLDFSILVCPLLEFGGNLSPAVSCLIFLVFCEYIPLFPFCILYCSFLSGVSGCSGDACIELAIFSHRLTFFSSFILSSVWQWPCAKFSKRNMHLWTVRWVPVEFLELHSPWTSASLAAPDCAQRGKEGVALDGPLGCWECVWVVHIRAWLPPLQPHRWKALKRETIS